MSTNTEFKFTKVEKFPVGNTGNALTSLSDDHIIGTAGDIYDTEFHDGAYQNEINKYLDNKFTDGISFEDKNTNESNEFNIYGVKYPLTVLYRDVNNNPVEFEYKAGNPVEGDNYSEEPGNNLNTIDLSRGVYYATTARTATMLGNPLTIQTAAGEIKYNGQTKEKINLASLIEITYDELVRLRDNSQLFPGQEYRIIDYETHISSVGTSAGHKFDVIVTALSCDTLSEDAKACLAKIPGSSDENTTNINFSYDVSKPYAGHSLSAGDWINTAVADIPSGIIDILSFAPSESSDVRYRTIDTSGGKQIYCNKGIIKVLWNWVTNSGSQRINILGVELLSEDNVVVSYDYHVGSTGTNQIKNIYTLTVPESGNYKLVYYIDGHSEDVNSTCTVYAYEAFEKYFGNSNLSAWELKYSLDNTSKRFGWPSSNGKGHIYYMKDEFGNECSYDFKNVKYENGTYYTFDYEINGTHFDGSVKYGNLCYDNRIPLDVSGANGKLDLPKIYFKNTTDTSQCHTNKLSHDSWNIIFGNGCYGNSVGEKSQNISFGNNCFHNVLKCSNADNKFGDGCNSNELGVGCTGNIFGNDCVSNTLEEGCKNNKFIAQCHSNKLNNDSSSNEFQSGCISNVLGRLNTSNKFGVSCCNNLFGNDCTENELGIQCNNNIFGNECTGNKFGDECFLNTFKDKLSVNIFGTGFYSNIMGENCKNNNFGNACYCNEFGDYCWNLTLGNLNTMNKFGHLCEKIHFRSSSSSTTPMAYVNNVEVGAGCYNITIYPKDVSISTSSSKIFKYYRIGPEIKNTTIQIEGDTVDSIVNRKYWTNIEKNSSGTIVQKCLMDSNNCFKTSYSNGTLTITSL